MSSARRWNVNETRRYHRVSQKNAIGRVSGVWFDTCTCLLACLILAALSLLACLLYPWSLILDPCCFILVAWSLLACSLILDPCPRCLLACLLACLLLVALSLILAACHNLTIILTTCCGWSAYLEERIVATTQKESRKQHSCIKIKLIDSRIYTGEWIIDGLTILGPGQLRKKRKSEEKWGKVEEKWRNGEEKWGKVEKKRCRISPFFIPTVFSPLFSLFSHFSSLFPFFPPLSFPFFLFFLFFLTFPLFSHFFRLANPWNLKGAWY